MYVCKWAQGGCLFWIAETSKRILIPFTQTPRFTGSVTAA